MAEKPAHGTSGQGHVTKGSRLWRWKPTSGFLLTQASCNLPMTHSLLGTLLGVWLSLCSLTGPDP